MIVPQTQKELEELYVAYYPGGSGPLTQMAIICKLLEEIAALRGYEIDFLALLAKAGRPVWKNYNKY